MSKTYTPGEGADAIIARLVAKGNFPSAEAVVRAGVRMIEEYEADLARLQRRSTTLALHIGGANSANHPMPKR